jgi:endonuclease V-like protein UPF0215 family
MKSDFPKKEIRILGIDDAPFDKFRDKETMIIGTIFRGGQFLDGLLTTTVDIDGEDATLKVIELIRNSKFRGQLRAIMLDGIAVGGFNIINIKTLYRETKIPVIVIMRDQPDMQQKVKLIEQLEKPKKIDDIYIQYEGLSLKDAINIIKISCTHSNIPEPIRIAHIIGQGIVFGESKGRA